MQLPWQAKDLRAKTSLPVLDELKPWMLAQRQAMTKGTAGAKALEYSLRRWEALTRYAHAETCRSTTTRLSG